MYYIHIEVQQRKLTTLQTGREGGDQIVTVYVFKRPNTRDRIQGGGGGGGGGAVICQCISVYCSFGARDITLVCS